MQPLAILILGGRSTRFWPLGEKPLLKFCGQTLFSRQLNLLKQAGLKRILVVGQKDNLPLLQKQKTPAGLTLTFAEQTNLDGGMAAALLDTAKHWQGQPILIASGNDIIEANGLKTLLKQVTQKKAAGAILAQKVTRYFPGGYLTLKNNLIQGLVEKPGAGKEPSDLVNLVFHYHQDSAALLSELQKAKSSKDDIYEVALDKLVKRLPYLAVPYTGFWQALKYPWHALKLNTYFLSQLKPKRDKSAQIAKTAVIKGNVVLGKNVRIFDHAVIQGPAYLGDNVVVGNNALVRESNIEANSVVGYNTEVARSLWQTGVQTHINYTGDSILSDNVALGAGAITANYRLDGNYVQSFVKGEKLCSQTTKFGAAIGKNTHLGVHVTLAPGIKVGADSLVGSHVYVDQDLPDGQFLYLKNHQPKIVLNREVNQAQCRSCHLE